MDSKSEYVRCLALRNPWSLYVCTNQGAVYHVHLPRRREVSWTLLIADLESPIVCMDVLVQGAVRDEFPSDDRVVVGTGSGRVTVLQVRRTGKQWHCHWRHTWAAEKERQLLGVYFCKSKGGRYIFTTDPRGTWRMWHIAKTSVLGDCSVKNLSSSSVCIDLPQSSNDKEDSGVFTTDLVAYGCGSPARILCIDVSTDLQLLVCGDKRGDLAAFLLPNDLLQWKVDGKKAAKSTEIAPTQLPVFAVFKGAHGISAIASVSVLPVKDSQQAQIISTGSDGCICRFLLNIHSTASMPQLSNSLVFTGIEKVTALSIVERVEYCKGAISQKHVERRIAAGFIGSDFVLWDLTHQCEVMRVTCGGWRRPHSVLVGDLPELQYCFVFVKDHVVQVQRNWITSISGGPGSSTEERALAGSNFSYPVPKLTKQSLRGQFHGKEIPSVLFLHTTTYSKSHQLSNPSSWIATGSEDGTVIISRYVEGIGEHLDPIELLADHVKGSAVRALALVAEVHLVNTKGLQYSDTVLTEVKASLFGNISGSARDHELLFSAGAKEVLTCWLLDWPPEVDCEEVSLDLSGSIENLSTPLVQDTVLSKHRVASSKWLSTHIHERNYPAAVNTSVPVSDIDNHETLLTEEDSEEQRKMQESHRRNDDGEDDQRYLALTAFATGCVKTGTMTSFVATASSNATLHLYAFQVSHRTWIELATLEYSSALVLTIEHLIAPVSGYGQHRADSASDCDVYMIITGGAHGNIALWDVTNLVQGHCNFDGLDANRALVAPLRPLTGRGSQGGRRRKKTWEQPNGSLNMKTEEGEPLERGEAADLDDTLTCQAEGNARSSMKIPFLRLGKRGVIVSSRCQLPEEAAETMPSLILNPFQELVSAHQSGINCMSVTRLQKVGTFDSSKMVYVLISGGDDQALHLATFTLEVDNSNDVGIGNTLNVESTAPRIPLVLGSLRQSRVPCAHNSSVKGVWTNGFWAFSTGLDQRLRCWRINADFTGSELHQDSCEADCSRHLKRESPLDECLTCVIDVPEPASLHVKECLGGLYEIAVVGRGLQVINFDSNSS